MTAGDVMLDDRRSTKRLVLTAPVPPPATAPSADFVPFSWPDAFEPTFCGEQH